MGFYYVLKSMVAVVAIKEITTRHRLSGIGRPASIFKGSSIAFSLLLTNKNLTETTFAHCSSRIYP